MSSNLGKPIAPPPSHSPAPQPSPATSSIETRRPTRPTQTPQHHQARAPRKDEAARRQWRELRKLYKSNHSAYLEAVDFTMQEPATKGGNARGGTGRRGQTSITHLLDYRTHTVPGMDSYHSHSRSYRRNPTWGPNSGYRPADKLRYVRANYRFVVSPEGYYGQIAADPDAQIDWNSVLQVIVSSQSQAMSCPICLSDPVAPRMAQCGHIFCLPCLIRYSNAESNEDEKNGGRRRTGKKCPICEDIVHLPDIRPARFYAGQESPLPRVGDDVIMRLMVRSSSSTLALPREGNAEARDSGDDIPWHFAVNVLDYARVMKGTPGYMMEQYDEEVAALEKQDQEDELMFGSDGGWNQKAIKTIRQAKEALNAPAKEDQGQSDEAAVLPSDDGDTQSPTAHTGPKARGKQASGPDFCFYASQPHLYLSPLDIRILKAKYGDYSLFPSTLLPRVEHISTSHVVDDVLRRRVRYLSHLPQGCVITFLECDWTDIVPSEILDKFAGEIQRRRRQNTDKEAQEERLRLRAENHELAAIRGLHMELSPEGAFSVPILPLDLDKEFLPLGASSANEGSVDGSPPNARLGFSQLSTSPGAQRTVWGTPAAPGNPDSGPSQDNIDDGWLREEDLEGLDDAAFAAQLEALGVEDGTGVRGGAAEGGAGAGSGGHKKKKKKQKITLMSTTARRGG
ncbi:related to human transcription regulator Staf-5 [Cephalotrichum gorgonifer]|uniref:Related to human transcription regulator Staf-5 n=1 Tax=Cephalotrichum gorgonifer TaxID=2041049 RepID=A0AAE8N5G1_9PEZI|nr:related to human transcription regulator Staf-5 [Cephalotrichum gorgonifer]